MNERDPLFVDIETSMGRYVEELCQFLRISGVSARKDCGEEMECLVRWLLNQLIPLGFQGEICKTEGYPILLARHNGNPEAPTLLIYGHYDVQPEEPLEEWITPPFEPDVRDGAIYARGSNDDKGQLYTYIKAMESYERVRGALGLNVIFLAEGEEEVGSKNLFRFLQERAEDLKSDIFLMSDSSMVSKDLPAITCGFRGVAAMELTIRTMRQDLHSGLFGGIGLNAAQVLAELLAKLKNAEGQITLPDFYKPVLPLTKKEREELALVPYDEVETAKTLGMNRLPGETGYTAMERKSARPTLDINGIKSGFTGQGSKMVIPAEASAKLSARLVPNQCPEVVVEQLRAFVAANIPAGVKWNIDLQFGSTPVLVEMDDLNVQLAAEAIKEGFGTAPALIRSGGTVHIISKIKDTLQVPSILILGWGRPENGSHSPNECFPICDFHKAIRSLCVLFDSLERRKVKL